MHGGQRSVRSVELGQARVEADRFAVPRVPLLVHLGSQRVLKRRMVVGRGESGVARAGPRVTGRALRVPRASADVGCAPPGMRRRSMVVGRERAEVIGCVQLVPSVALDVDGFMLSGSLLSHGVRRRVRRMGFGQRSVVVDRRDVRLVPLCMHLPLSLVMLSVAGVGLALHSVGHRLHDVNRHCLATNCDAVVRKCHTRR